MIEGKEYEEQRDSVETKENKEEIKMEDLMQLLLKINENLDEKK